MIPPGVTSRRAVLTPVRLSLWGKSYAELGQFDEALRSVEEAKEVIKRTGETWFEVGVHCIAGEAALNSTPPDATKAEAHFERALAVARQQEAKSWELRAATSMARLWRDQGKPQQARALLAPVYGWFTEGFDTRDLKEAKTLLEELASAAPRHSSIHTHPLDTSLNGVNHMVRGRRHGRGKLAAEPWPRTV